MKINDNGTIKDLVVKASDTLPIGSIIPFGGTKAPTNWLICDGSMLSREAYPELFKAIGTSFGTDGENNFYIPDLRGRVIVGQDTSDADFGLGSIGGEKTHKLTYAEMPKHGHSMLGNPNEGSTAGTSYLADVVGNPSFGSTAYTSVEGGDQPHNNLQPYTVTNYIIKAKQSIGVVGNVVNEKTESDKDTYGCDYINGVQGTILYKTTSPNREVIALNDNITNYEYIEVIGANADGGRISSGKINVDNNMRINLFGTSLRDDEATLCFWMSTLLANGTTLTPQTTKWAWLTSTGQIGISDGNYMGVLEVIGYK